MIARERFRRAPSFRPRHRAPGPSSGRSNSVSRTRWRTMSRELRPSGRAGEFWREREDGPGQTEGDERERDRRRTLRTSSAPLAGRRQA